MPKFHLRGDAGQILRVVDGELFTVVLAGTTYQFGTHLDDKGRHITELSSGHKVATIARGADPVAWVRQHVAPNAARFASAVRAGAALAAKMPMLPPLPGALK